MKRILKLRPGLPLTCAALTLVSFLCGLALFFPTDRIRQRLESEINRTGQANLQISKLSFRLPLALEARDVTVALAGPKLPPLHFASISITPTLSALAGNPGLRLQSSDDEGTLAVTCYLDQRVVLEAEQYRFELPIPGLQQLRGSGIINRAHISGQLRSGLLQPEQVAITADRLSLSGATSLGATADQLDLGSLVVNASSDGRSLNIDAARLEGGVLRASASGSIIPGATPASTRIALSTEFTPAEGADPALASLLELIGRPGSGRSRTATIGGSLARPSLR